MGIFLSLSRVLVGGLFIFSGLIKANDPLGFSYKLDEYFLVFGMDWLVPASLVLSILICILEVVCGLAVLTGSQMKIFGPLILVMILFFTWLTGWSHFTGEVTDCGCFGDAIKLTPKESFIKDIILLGFVIPIFLARNRIQPILKAMSSKLIMAGGILGTTVFTLWCYYHLPMKDFRPYKIGASITEGMTLPPDAKPWIYETVFIYKNKASGEIEDFVNTVPTDYENWEYVDREDRVVQEGFIPPIHDFILSDEDGNDVTESYLSNSDYALWVISYDLDETSIEAFKELNSLAPLFQEQGLEFVCITATPEIEEFRHTMQTGYPFLLADGTMLKTTIRSNPGLMLMKAGVVVDKWHYNDFPSFSELTKYHLSK